MGHCCIWRPLKPASSTRVPERHRRWQRLTALSTSDTRTDGKRLHFATRQPHHRARCNSAIEAAGELRAAIADNKGQPSSLWMRKFDPQLTGAAGTTPCVRRASVFECCWESAGVLLPAAIIRFLKACVSLSMHSVQTAAVISLRLPSARRWAARNGAKRAGTPSDGGRAFVHVTSDDRNQVGMEGDSREDGAPTCKIAGIAYTGSNPVPATPSDLRKYSRVTL